MFCKKEVPTYLQILQENTCAKDSFFKLQFYRVYLYQKRDSGTDGLLVNYAKFLIKSFLENPSAAASAKTLVLLYSQHDAWPFQKRCYT